MLARWQVNGRESGHLLINTNSGGERIGSTGCEMFGAATAWSIYAVSAFQIIAPWARRRPIGSWRRAWRPRFNGYNVI